MKRKSSTLDDEGEEEEWETLPDELIFEDAERQEREDEVQELESLSQKIEEQQQHADRTTSEGNDDVDKVDWWDCPICSRPQSPDERSFNAHIDLCLSRQTIRDVVQETSNIVPVINDPAPPPLKKSRHERDRGKEKGGNGSAGDPRQRRLFFG